MTPTARSLGDHLREWRQRRRMSQLDLALEAEISQRHLSFIESGRSTPSRDMLLHLAERLDVPLRDRNPLLLAAGFAPVFAERALDDPALEPARRAIDMVLKGHEPFPAIAVDRHWTLIAANAAIAPLLSAVADQSLLTPPVNVLRLSLHPQGLAPHIKNLSEWRAHLIGRLRQQFSASGDPMLDKLLKELLSYPALKTAGDVHTDHAGIAVPLQLSTKAGLLSLISTTTVFGTPVDITLSELAVESFFPADDETAAILRSLALN
ncbi:helix-turn-helix transcriptional regulator [Rhizobium sophorae]|uniref:Helix-turn-helix transcriptional regulator n=1 Tax=Rhizobium sophorae TaxID=1535242 RepID=A0A7Y3SAH1_9HYPH|nr:helix-turn-helix transcriptional regulator [Rhizobium sophorae]MBX4863682.1 helix-turn-helix transcriptional regulator [Rhizobium bangladeshense]NKK72641.1 helix-turn-helix domain-containing protein [Rhizobium leguminosarum bv. viciae]NKL32406.1 helix-turn-helix domain-containing protein [Rhizobium leguminosarum bv. viciae]NNU39945.1 helix-turn-helix transcriptional regulator [Rhizobium sophorae]